MNNIRHQDACEILRLVKSRKGSVPQGPVFPDRIALEAFLRKLGDHASSWGLTPAGIDRIREALEEHLARRLPADVYAGKVFPDRANLEWFMDHVDDAARDHSAGPEGASRIYQVVRAAIEENFGQGLPERESDTTLFPNKFSLDTFLGRVAQVAPNFGLKPKDVGAISETLLELFGAGFQEWGTPRRQVRQRRGARRAVTFQSQADLNGFLKEAEGIARAVGVEQGRISRLRNVLVERFGQH